MKIRLQGIRSNKVDGVSALLQSHSIDSKFPAN